MISITIKQIIIYCFIFTFSLWRIGCYYCETQPNKILSFFLLFMSWYSLQVILSDKFLTKKPSIISHLKKLNFHIQPSYSYIEFSVLFFFICHNFCAMKSK